MRRKLKSPKECNLKELGERYQHLLNKNKIYYQEHKQEQLIRNKKWRDINPEKYKESCKKSSKLRALKNRKNPLWVRPKNEEERKQRKKERKAKWYQENKEKIAEKYKDKKIS